MPRRNKTSMISFAPRSLSVMQVRSVQSAVNYIQRHLDEKFEVDALAAVGSYSRFHFQRLFRAVTGETLYDFIRRVRLESAATWLLTYRELMVVDVAFESGFSSHESFARAFHRYFGRSATQWREEAFWRHDGERWQWRKSRDPGAADAQSRVAAGASGMRYDSLVLAEAANGRRPVALERIGVERVSPFRIAYLRKIGVSTAAGDAMVWWRLVDWARREGLMVPQAMLVCTSCDNVNITAPAQYRFDAGLMVERDFRPDGEIDVQDFSGGSYAVADFAGTWSEHAAVDE
jgi:AraC family transcriptional regulator